MPLLDGDVVDVAALAYAAGRPPPTTAFIRQTLADFRVDEACSIVPSGVGEHIWLRVEKTGLTTPEAAEAISRAAGVHPRHIGFAGLKDKRAITTQWFSMAWPIKQAMPTLDAMPDVRVLEIDRHDRKLKRGAHRGNRFTLVLRDLSSKDAGVFDADVTRVIRAGVPNYFGAQRFGGGGRNIALSRALFAGKRLSRNRRGFALSAARSLLFNAVVDARVTSGHWDRLIEGDAFMLDGSHSVFAWQSADQHVDELEQRLATFDIHPSGPLPGVERESLVSGQARRIEAAVLACYPELLDGLHATGVEASRRALRLPVPDLSATRQGGDVTLRFSLPSGAFATSVLRELVVPRAPGDAAPRDRSS